MKREQFIPEVLIRLHMDIWILSEDRTACGRAGHRVLNNNAKTPLFSVEERVKMLNEVTRDMTNVIVVPFDGLLVEFAKRWMPV